MNRKQRRREKKLAPGSPIGDSVERQFAQAVTHHRTGALNEAQAAYRRVLALRPDHPDAHYNLGLVHYAKGALDRAVDSYHNALVARPDYVDAHVNLGIACKDLGRLDEAEAACRRSVSLDPTSLRGLDSLGSVLIEQGKLDEAAFVLREAIAIDPNDSSTLCNLVAVLPRLRKFGEAIALGRRAVALRPDSVITQYNLAIAYRENGSIEDSIAAFTRVLTLDPRLAEAHFGLAQSLLLRGDFERGWREFEWRWKLNDYAWIRDVRGVADKPRWSGEDIASKTILILAEQGLGDTIQFIRFLPLVVARAGRVIFAAQPALVPLLGAIPRVTVIRLDETSPDFDVHCPLISLPRLFATPPATIPAETPYVAADPPAVNRWRSRLGGEGLRIGIAWQGKPGGVVDRGRSIPLAAFAPLSQVPKVRLISLQKNAGIEQLSDLPEGMSVETLGPDFDRGPGAFLDTAAVMMNLDLIVTSDTAIAHLAGALGRETWVALKAVPDWRWRLDSPRSPWYPTMRLFRQSVSGEWDAVFAWRERWRDPPRSDIQTGSHGRLNRTQIATAHTAKAAPTRRRAEVPPARGRNPRRPRGGTDRSARRPSIPPPRGHGSESPRRHTRSNSGDIGIAGRTGSKG
jgi:tetratricopeptide (TPR) repeat protein